MDYKELLKNADEAKESSYSPYSKFRVGAAVLTESGNIYTGCNIENISYGLTNCAERTAIFKAVSEKEKKLKAIAISSDKNEFCYPCGACRQVIHEFGSDIDVIMGNPQGEYEVKKISELLPLAFK